ncbi:MAG: hypothetical protein U5K43_15020, partial [Halofilum sp. (in: g-proteobacteria)]|nr:hypothetical protein [Halofilum sp. (in: g-proteobacteria)]
APAAVPSTIDDTDAHPAMRPGSLAWPSSMARTCPERVVALPNRPLKEVIPRPASVRTGSSDLTASPGYCGIA